MSRVSLAKLYEQHRGRTSDKWFGYLEDYDHLLGSFRGRSIRLLEIGVQNGGSLEIWSHYFPKAVKIVGCDINPDCALLHFEDPRIAVIAGDINHQETRDRIQSVSPEFDIIIDDGSHLSGDIVRTFASLFPILRDGGAYVAEDLHCSYWQDYEGGLFNPYSAMTFFKQLADVLNHEHWGVGRERCTLYSSFRAEHGIELEENVLAQVHRVTFVNSLCVIHKAHFTRNLLGRRVIAGTQEEVATGHRALHGHPVERSDQSNNVWSRSSLSPYDELPLRLGEISSLRRQIEAADRDLATRDLLISELKDDADRQKQEIVRLDAQIRDRVKQLDILASRVESGQQRHLQLKKTLAVRENTLRQVTDSLTAGRNRISKLVQSAKVQDRQIERLGKKLDHLAQLSAKQEELIASNERERATQEQQLSHRRRQIANLTRTIKRRDRRLADRKVSLEDHAVRMESLLGTVNKQRQKLEARKEAEREYMYQIAGMADELTTKNQRIAELAEKQISDDGHIENLYRIIDELRNSTSWKITWPMRVIALAIRRFAVFFRHIAIATLNIRRFPQIARIIRRKGIANIESSLSVFDSDYFSDERGFTKNFSESVLYFGNLFISLKKLFAQTKLYQILCKLLETNINSEININNGSVKFCIDYPTKLFSFCNNPAVIHGWCADITTAAAIPVRVRVGSKILQPHLKQRRDVQEALAPLAQLPVQTGFAVVASLTPGIHRVQIELSSRDDLWVPVSRAYVLRRPRFNLFRRNATTTYHAWCKADRKRLKAEQPEMIRHAAVMVHKPLFFIILDIRGHESGWKASLRSIKDQIYTLYEIGVLADNQTNLSTVLGKGVRRLDNSKLSNLPGDFTIFMEPGQILTIDALYAFANAVNLEPETDIIYADQDSVSGSGKRTDPYYKPCWSPDTLETFNYVGFPAAMRTRLLHGNVFDFNLYDQMLRCTEQTSAVRHIARILGSIDRRPNRNKESGNTTTANIAALQGRLLRTGRRGIVRQHPKYGDCLDAVVSPPRWPFVSIIIPTAGQTVMHGGHPLDLIVNVVDHLRKRTRYERLEIVIVDNGDLSERQCEVLAKSGCRRTSYNDPVFNVAAKLNQGVRQASGELLLLMNDDIEVLVEDWIQRMAEHFEKPHVGVVGARLLYPDGRIQHAGVVHNRGNPDHVRRLFPGDDAGYFFSTCGTRNFMAVTGAVMMTRASDFHSVGGYSEELAISYNDADYCLKLKEKGLHCVYAPNAVLTHMESQSRVAVADQSEVRWYHQRWAERIISDPYYNEQFLTVASPTYEPHVNRRIV